MQAIGELDEDDPDVRGHRDHHLAVVLGLRLVAAREGDAGELGDAVDERGDLVAEALSHLVERCARVLDGVVQQCRAQRLGVQAHARADLGHADRVDDELLARLAALIGVVLAREEEGVLDALAVDLDRRVVGVLLDDREEVAEQPPLGLGQLGAEHRLVRLGVRDAIDRDALGGRVRAVARRRRGGGLGRVGAWLGGHPQRVPPASAGATGLRRGFAALSAARPGRRLIGRGRGGGQLRPDPPAQSMEVALLPGVLSLVEGTVALARRRDRVGAQSCRRLRARRPRRGERLRRLGMLGVLGRGRLGPRAPGPWHDPEGGAQHQGEHQPGGGAEDRRADHHRDPRARRRVRSDGRLR